MHWRAFLYEGKSLDATCRNSFSHCREQLGKRASSVILAYSTS